MLIHRIGVTTTRAAGSSPQPAIADMRIPVRARWDGLFQLNRLCRAVLDTKEKSNALTRLRLSQIARRKYNLARAQRYGWSRRVRSHRCMWHDERRYAENSGCYRNAADEWVHKFD